jgi:hypothetical protein
MVLRRFALVLLLRESIFAGVLIRLWIGGIPCNLTLLVCLELV